LIADALHPYPDGLLLATKGGVVKKSATERYLDGSPEGLRRDCEESLRNLQVDCIDLYQLHWVDPDVLFAESGGLAKLRSEGKIRSIGLCNITLEQLREASGIAPIASVQNRYSVAETESDSIVSYCAQHGIGFIPYGPLGADPMKPGAPLAGAGGVLAEIAQELHTTTAQIALSWLLHRSANILPIPGTTSIAHLQENVTAAALVLTDEHVQRLEKIGERRS
jgi:pyridoxine 4-dehydrogenase